MTKVIVAASVLIIWIARVRQSRCVLGALRPFVKGMAISIGCQETEAMIVAAVHSHLQSVVVGVEPVGCLKDIRVIRKLGCIRPCSSDRGGIWTARPYAAQFPYYT